METFTPTTNANAIPTVVAMETIRLLPAFMGLAKFVSKDTDWTGRDFASYGDTLNIVKPGSLTVKKKTPGSKTVAQAPDADKLSVTLNQHDYIKLLQEDITKLLQKPDLQAQYARNAAIKLAESIEAYLFALHPNITQTVSFDATSEATMESSFLTLRGRFATNKVPLNEVKGLFAGTSVVNKLLSVQKYSSGDYVQGPVIEMGALRKIYNVGVFESQLVATSGSPITTHNIALTPLGMVLVSRPMPLDGNGKGVVQTNITDPNTGLTFRLTEGYSIDDMGTVFQMDVLYGGAIADTAQIIEFESKV